MAGNCAGRSWTKMWARVTLWAYGTQAPPGLAWLAFAWLAFVGMAFVGMACASVDAQSVDHSTFATSDQCIACHSNIVDADGKNVSIGHVWRGSMMAHSARDPYWQASVRREVTDHPGAQAEIEDTCSTCHMPMARVVARENGGLGEVFAHLEAARRGEESALLAMDGVSCTACHQIQPDNLGEESSFDGNFVIRTEAGVDPQIFGPFEVDDGLTRVMQSATGFLPDSSTHVQQSEFCATCHTLFTTSLDAEGREVARFPEQTPYLEWRHSAFAESESCQSCHMPETASAPISSVLGEYREGVSQHVFRGGNEFMLRLMDKYRDELLVTAPPGDLQRAAEATRENLETATARLEVLAVSRDEEHIAIDLEVTNLAGHKLPTAYPSRRAWIHLEVRDDGGNLVFESGAMNPDGSIEGNDNDADASRYEPHYQVIDDPGQVQIYEPIIADGSGRVTTGLLTAVTYAKDNRLLPEGFDRDTAAAAIMVHGEAGEDADFQAGSDRIRYRVEAPDGPLSAVVRVRLMFQTIGFRWAQNLAPYDARETKRFVTYYNDNASTSAVVLAEAARRLDLP
ncbi:MAG: hypothetical protein F4Y38_08355 [Gemmatimonadetes bacterium]|nr:hypothetical protein [Gemmatimonadota bacterium]MYG84497.1 hypothetical protein [Gemmatimonadota bacterium]MYJ91376.1 hypothetical protein [Gemmatimonadota bacterium]